MVHLLREADGSVRIVHDPWCEGVFSIQEWRTFLMGNDRRLPDALLSPTCFRCGDFDERPVHRVTITKRFRMAECQVTNAQYEMFDPAHASGNGTAHYVLCFLSTARHRL